MNTVGIQSTSRLNQPIFVVDYSKPIVEKIIEEVEIVKEGMEVISERYNPFFKKTVYKIERFSITGFKVVGSYFDYPLAVRVAKQYARKNGLKYEK